MLYIGVLFFPTVETQSIWDGRNTKSGERMDTRVQITCGFINIQEILAWLQHEHFIVFRLWTASPFFPYNVHFRLYLSFTCIVFFRPLGAGSRSLASHRWGPEFASRSLHVSSGGGWNGVWVVFSRGLSGFPLSQIIFNYFSILNSFISFHFIGLCDCV